MPKDKLIIKHISITKGELEVLEEYIPLSNTLEDAIVNGIINQIKENK